MAPTPLPVKLEVGGADGTTVIVLSSVGGVLVLAGLMALNRKFSAGVETAKAFSDVGPQDPAKATRVHRTQNSGSSAGGGFTGRATHVIQTIDGSLIAIDPGTSVALSPHMGQRGQVVPFEALQSLHGRKGQGAGGLPVAVAMQEPRAAVKGIMAKATPQAAEI